MSQDLKRHYFFAAGEVDEGKSTLMGRLLFDTNSLYEDQIQSLLNESSDIENALAFVTDGLRYERENRITMETAYRFFSINKIPFVLVDTPGHEIYLHEMISGVTQCQSGILLVDAVRFLQRGISLQTKRQLSIIFMLGIPNLLVAINKMDLLGYDLSIYKMIKDQIQHIVQENLRNLQSIRGTDLPPTSGTQVHFVPISALKGDQIASVSSRWIRRKENTFKQGHDADPTESPTEEPPESLHEVMNLNIEEETDIQKTLVEYLQQFSNLGTSQSTRFPHSDELWVEVQFIHPPYLGFKKNHHILSLGDLLFSQKGPLGKVSKIYHYPREPISILGEQELYGMIELSHCNFSKIQIGDMCSNQFFSGSQLPFGMLNPVLNSKDNLNSSSVCMYFLESFSFFDENEWDPFIIKSGLQVCSLRELGIHLKSTGQYQSWNYQSLSWDHHTEIKNRKIEINSLVSLEFNSSFRFSRPFVGIDTRNFKIVFIGGLTSKPPPPR